MNLPEALVYTATIAAVPCIFIFANPIFGLALIVGVVLCVLYSIL